MKPVIRRSRSAKIVATLGPASNSEAMIDTLFLAGVDVFRMNFSHGSHADHAATSSFYRRPRQGVAQGRERRACRGLSLQDGRGSRRGPEPYPAFFISDSALRAPSGLSSCLNMR